MSDDDTQVLLEAAVGAHRERDRDGRIVPAPAWWDLSPRQLEELFEQQVISREIERAIDRQGESGTVKAVMRRIRGM